MLFEPSPAQTIVLTRIYNLEVLLKTDWHSTRSLKERGLIEWRGDSFRLTREGVVVVQRIQRRSLIDGESERQQEAFRVEAGRDD